MFDEDRIRRSLKISSFPKRAYFSSSLFLLSSSNEERQGISFFLSSYINFSIQFKTGAYEDDMTEVASSEELFLRVDCDKA
jgi:hypothetical protein